jgi:glycosyltransferase involved in cell wall biosynthesis
MKKINIIYLLPELKGASGGAKVIYNHSLILNHLNKKIISTVTHLKKKISYKLEASISKKIKLFDQKKAGWDVTKMKVSKNFAPDKKWFNEKINIGKNLNFDKDKDFIIIPEIWSHFAIDLNLHKRKINYAIFVQGFYHMNSTNDFSKIRSAYKNAKLILTISEYNIKHLKEMFPESKNKILKVHFSIDCKKFNFKKKTNLITYMPRKLPDHSNLLNFYLKNLLPKNWIITPLSNLTEKQLIDMLSKSKIFLSFSNLEGTGIPPIEAALSGNQIIGYTGGGGSEYWQKPIFTKVENGEIRDFGQKVLSSIKKYNNSWIKDTKIQRQKLSSQYSKEIEIKSMVNFSNKVLKFF